MANNISNVWKLMGIDPTTGTGTYKNRMGLGNAITRDNGIPLDLSTLHATYNDAVVYAATSSIAYVDQPIAAEGVLYLITEESQGKVKISSYRDSITGKLVSGEEKEYDVYLKRVGIVPTGDNASITVTAEGLVSLFGFGAAENGMLPVREEGKLVWKTLEAIGAGDGNDNTTYEFEVCEHKTGIIITPLFNGQPIMEGEGEEAKQVKYHLDLDVYTKGEVDSAIASAVDGLVDSDTLTGAIEAVEVKIPTVPINVGAFTNDAGYLVASDIEGKADKSTTYTKDEVDTAISTAVEGILGEDVKEAYNTLKEIQDILEGTDGEAIDGLIEIADANKQAIEVLNGAATVEGSVAKQIADAVDPLATTAELERVEGIANSKQTAEQVSSAISTALADYTNTETLNGLLDGKVDNADLANYYTKEEVYAKNEVYTKGEADKAIADKISEVNGGESAGEVLGQLNAYKKINDTEVWGAEKVTEWTDEEGKYNPTYTGDSRVDVINRKLDTIEEGAEVNIIKAVKVNGTALTITNKAVDITDNMLDITGMGGYTELSGRVTTNANNITALTGQLGTTNENVSDILTRLGALETEVGVEEKSRIDVLEGVLNGSEEADGLVDIVTGHGTKIGLLEAADTRIEKKADDNAVAILALQNKVNTGDLTVTAYVTQEIGKIKGYDDTEVRGLITAEAERAASEEARIEGLVTAEAARADAEEKRIAALVGTNTTAIEEINALLNTVSNEDNITSLKELAIWVEDHETEVLPVIEQQGKDITAIDGRVTAVETAVSTTLPAAIAQALTDAKAYTDEKMVKADGTSIVNNEGTFSVNAVSTDLLVQGTMTLVLNGGDAQVTA